MAKVSQFLDNKQFVKENILQYLLINICMLKLSMSQYAIFPNVRLSLHCKTIFHFYVPPISDATYEIARCNIKKLCFILNRLRLSLFRRAEFHGSSTASPSTGSSTKITTRMKRARSTRNENSSKILHSLRDF